MTTLYAQRMHTMKPSSIREMLKLTERPGVISFAGGLPAPELFPVDEIRSAAERVLAESGAQAFQYGASEGMASLRARIADEMVGRGIACAADDVLITTGTGAGQRRRIASHTLDTLTLASAVTGNANITWVGSTGTRIGAIL